MHCFKCCQEALDEFYDLREEDYAALFREPAAKDLAEGGQLSEPTYKALEEFFLSRLISVARYQIFTQDDDGNIVSVLVCFRHWFDAQ